MNHSETKGLYQRGNIWWFRPPMRDGVRPQPITLQTTDLTEAITRAKECRQSPVLTPAGELELEIDHFLAHKKQRKTYSESTARAKRNSLRAFVGWLPAGTAMGSVSNELVQKYYEHVLGRNSVATAHKALMDIRAWMRWALEIEKKIRRNPALGVREEPVIYEPCVLFCTKEQRDKLINECPREDLKLVLMLGFHAGMRKREIIEAVPDWFRMEEKRIVMRSTPTMVFNRYKRMRDLPMRRVLHTFLESYGMRSPFLLRPDVKRGKDLYRYDFDLPMQTYMKAQNMEWVTSKVMRHTYASLLVQRGESLFKVAKRMGDTTAVVEKHYAHLAPNDEDVEE